MDKKGVSPLIATVVIVMIVVALGAIVANLVMNMIEDNKEQVLQSSTQIDCGVQVATNLVKIGTSYQICKTVGTVDTNVTVILENSGNKDIVDFAYTGIFDTETMQQTSSGFTLAQGETKQMDLNMTSAASLRQIRIMPVIMGLPGKPNQMCTDRAQIWEVADINDCPLSS